MLENHGRRGARWSLAAVLPLVLLILAGCGGDEAKSPALGSSQQPGKASGGGGSAGGLDGMDLCGLVSDTTLDTAGLSVSDGVRKNWVNSPACVYGENKATRLIVMVDYDPAVSIEKLYDKVKDIDGHTIGVEFDSEKSCQLGVDVGSTRAEIIVEKLGSPSTPTRPCVTGDGAIKDILTKVP